jgi:hypothetical protein
MAESSFSTRHCGASVCCTGNVTMVHTFASLVSEVEVIEAERGPVCVKVTKDSNLGPQRMDGMTVVHLDWTTACQVAEAVTHRLEEPDHEGQCIPMRLVR